MTNATGNIFGNNEIVPIRTLRNAIVMKLEGQVTNVTHFGAFVDIGVHQDGLIHISELADHFVNDPAQEVAVGDVVRVTVLEVDEQRKRVSLSRRRQ